MSAEGGEKAVKGTGILSFPSSARRSVKRTASFAEVEEQGPAKMPKIEFDFAGKTEGEISKHLDDLKKLGHVEGLKTAQEKLRKLNCQDNITVEARKIYLKASNKAAIYMNDLSHKTVADTSLSLGSGIRSVGFGSSAGKPENREQVNKILSSCENDDRDRKGAMLAHTFYRMFLKHFYSNVPDNLKGAMEHFQKSLQLIWQETALGVVRKKNATGSTPEPAATSLLAAIINQLISKMLGIDEGKGEAQIPHPFIKWVSEYTLEHTVSDETNKKRYPRTDGMLVAGDTHNSNSLRALVSMEAKLEPFGDSDNCQSRSNAIDAFSQQPEDITPWPLLLFRYELHHKTNDSVKILAFVPTKHTTAKAVSLWESTKNEDAAICRSIVAAVLATKEFVHEIHRNQKTPSFCSVHGNVVLDKDENMIYKCFLETERRQPNIELIQKFVDPDAEEIVLGEKDCYVKMKWVGKILADDNTCCIRAFFEIAQEVQRLHKMNYCHGDVRVSNLILHPEGGNQKAKLIDFDFSGITGKQTYPHSLQNLVDGERHVDVQNAIESRTIGKMVLKEEHDWFSLAAAMKCFDATKEDYQTKWSELITNVEKSTSNDAKVNCFSEVDLD